MFYSDLKDKLSIMLENDDLRKGMVRFEDQYFYSKVRSRCEPNINGTISHK